MYQIMERYLVDELFLAQISKYILKWGDDDGSQFSLFLLSTEGNSLFAEELAAFAVPTNPKAVRSSTSLPGAAVPLGLAALGSEAWNCMGAEGVRRSDDDDDDDSPSARLLAVYSPNRIVEHIFLLLGQKHSI